MIGITAPCGRRSFIGQVVTDECATDPAPDGAELGGPASGGKPVGPLSPGQVKSELKCQAAAAVLGGQY